jgi:cellulose synthase/poly-beta-1,6-N-acetylglucosamine synthase-like glycosyltransferase
VRRISRHARAATPRATRRRGAKIGSDIGDVVVLWVGVTVFTACVTITGAAIDGRPLSRLAYVGAAALLASICWAGIVWLVRARHAHDAEAPVEAMTHEAERPGSFSVVMPSRDTAAHLDAALAYLVAAEPPGFKVRVAVGHGNAAVRKAALRAAARHPHRVRVVRADRDTERRGAHPAVLHVEPLATSPVAPRRRVRIELLGAPVFAAAGAAIAAQTHAAALLYLIYVGLLLFIGAICWSTLVWMLHAWRTPNGLTESRRVSGAALDPAHSFSLIVPARHEEAVLETTLSRLVATEHPDFEILVVVGDDDPATREVAERVATRYPHVVRVVVDHSDPKNKPKALNTALPHCRGDVTGVFDAEDDVHPGLLRRVDETFGTTGADIVQAGVQLMNFRSSWLTVRNVLEYYFWFRSRLHVHARQGFIPLGGNTVFVRTEILRAVAGWDPDCLAEDCEIGVRLSALGARTVVFYDPQLVTREECPPTLRAFARQRTRWNQGYLQTLSRGYWRRLPLRQRLLGAYILTMPYVMAMSWVLVPIAIATAVFVKAPVTVSMISFLPAIPMLSILAIELIGLGDFGREYGERPSARDYGRLIVGMPVYQLVLAFSAARAVAREARGSRGWEKTEHHGLHLDGARAANAARSNGSPAPSPVGGAAMALAAAAGDPAMTATTITARPPASGITVRTDHRASLGAPAGNGHAANGGGANGSSPHFHPSIDHLFGVVRREPLWARLAAATPNGSTAASMPLGPADPPVAAVRRDRAQALRDIAAAVAARAGIVVPVAVVSMVAIVQLTNMLHWPAVQFDEGTYVANAWAVQNRGALSNYTYTYGHPPLAWLLIAAWTFVRGAFGQATYSVDSARELMSVLSVVSAGLVYTLARRLAMNRLFAVVAVLLFTMSPVALFFHRGVLLDNPATIWAIAAFVLALTPRRHIWAFGASGACFAASVLSKETTLVMLPALILAAAQNSDGRTRRYCVTLFLSFLVLIGLGYVLYATLKGELLPGPGHVSLVGANVDQLFLRKATGSVFDTNSVTHGTVTFWLSLDPWLLGAAIVFAPIALVVRKTRAIALALLIQVAMVLRPGYLPGMYVTALLPFAALVIAGTGQTMWRIATRRAPRRPRTAGHGAWRAFATALPRYAAPAAALTVLAVSTAIAVQVVAPKWIRADRAAMTTRLDGPQRAAERWILRNVSHEQRIIVTDDVWIFLIEHGFDSTPVKGGFNSRTVVSYWPLDKDPAVRARFPNGWRDFDYIVSTEPMRDTAIYTPSTRQALANSRVVRSYGRGGARVEIREITPPGPHP